MGKRAVDRRTAAVFGSRKEAPPITLTINGSSTCGLELGHLSDEYDEQEATAAGCDDEPVGDIVADEDGNDDEDDVIGLLSTGVTRRPFNLLFIVCRDSL